MPNPSSSVTFSRDANAGEGAKPMPVFRVRKRYTRSGSAKLGSNEPKQSAETRIEVPGTEAFQEMFVTHRSKFVAVAYSILRNTEDAEDAVQNAFISGYQHLRNFQGRSALKTWFTRVVLNAALMIRRKRKLVELVPVPEWAAEEGGQRMDRIPSPEADPEMYCAKAEALGLIEELTAQLKPRLREAFFMYYGNEMSISQARAIAGVAVSTFKARLFRARHQVITEAKRALVRRPHKQASDGFPLSAVS